MGILQNHIKPAIRRVDLGFWCGHSGGVAQVVRACGSYPQSHWFKSSHRHQKKRRVCVDIFSTDLIFQFKNRLF